MTINLTPLSGNVTSLNRLFDAVFKQFGDLIAFSHGNTSITYSGLDHKSRMLAGWLQHNSGLEPGDRVAIQLPNTIQFPLCMLAVLRAGFVIVNANPSYTPAELNQLLIDSGAKALITFAPLARKAQIAMNGTQINCVILTELGDLMPPLKGKVLNQYIQRLAMPFSKHAIPDAFWLKDLLRQEFSSKWQPTYPSENQLALIQYTGGTTGTPKGAMLSHQNLCANLFQIKQLLEIYTQSGQERLIQPLPLYHIYAFTLTLAFFSQGLIPDSSSTLKRHVKRSRLFQSLNRPFVPV
ncbi:MAG: AMP-binding protein [Nitrincola sp.]|nr:AMP-binding protein [Nitrincola sp.]